MLNLRQTIMANLKRWFLRKNKDSRMQAEDLKKIINTVRFNDILLTFKDPEDFKCYCDFLINKPNSIHDNSHSFWNSYYKLQNNILKDIEEKNSKYDLCRNEQTREEASLSLERLINEYGCENIKANVIYFDAFSKNSQYIYADEYEKLEELANIIDKRYHISSHKTKFACIHWNDHEEEYHSPKVSIHRVLIKE